MRVGLGVVAAVVVGVVAVAALAGGCPNNVEDPTCINGERECRGTCTPILNDPSNCGGCGHLCLPGQNCLEGLCTSESGGGCGGKTECTNGQGVSECFDTTSDNDHCGDCDNACGDGEKCERSVCVTAC